MDMLDVIAQSHGGRGVQVLGAKFGLTERETRAAIDQLAPAVMAGIRRQLQSGPDGVTGVVKAIATGNHGRYLDRDDDGIVDDGNAILGHVFRSKDVSRGVADRAAAASGVSADILRKMLPVVTAMVMGGLSQQLMGAPTGTDPAEAARPNRRVSTGRTVQSPQSRTAQPARAPAPAPAKVTTSRSTGSKATAAPRPAPAPTPPPGKVASRTVQPVPAPPVRTGAAPQPARSPAPAPEAGGIGGLLGQLLGGGGPGAGSAGGGGIGGLLGQLVGGGNAGGGSAGGGGIGDLLQGILGGNADPGARAQATQSIGDLLSGLLGGGTPRGNDADSLLDAVTRSRTGR